MPLSRIKAKLPKKAQLKKMSREERVETELKLAAEVGVHHRGGIATGDNFRSTRTTLREPGFAGLKRLDAKVRRFNDDDVQPDSLAVGSAHIIKTMPLFSHGALEKEILAHVERMGERSFETMARQVLPQLNALTATGKKSRRMKAVQTALSKRVFGTKALAAMKRKKVGGIQG